MLRDVFVSGLRDRHILDRLFQDDIDLEKKTLKIAFSIEKAVQDANEIIGKPAKMKVVKFVVKAGKKDEKSRKQSFVFKTNKNETCTRCLGTNENKFNCRFINSECRICKKIGLIDKACFSAKKNRSVKQKKIDSNNDCDSKNEVPMYACNFDKNILKEEEPKKPPIMIQVKIKK